MNLCIVDPHFTDEFIQPVRQRIRGRKAIGKFSYLKDCDPSALSYCFSGDISGIIPKRLFSKLPLFLRPMLLAIEGLVFKSQGTEILPNPYKANATSFLYTVRNATPGNFLQISDLINQGCTVYGLCSHAHLLESHLSKLDNRVTLLCDEEVAHHPWFARHERKIYAPLIPSARFQERTSWDSRDQKIFCPGTVHQHEHQMNGFRQMPDGMFTLHPSRYDVMNNGDVSIFEKAFSLIHDNQHLAVSQSGYMKIDLPDEYNKYRYGFVGSDAIGIAANGLYEGMASGCEMFLESTVAETLGMRDGMEVWTFSGDSKNLEDKFRAITSRGYRLSIPPSVTAEKRRDLGRKLVKKLGLT